MYSESDLEREVAQALRALPTDDARPCDWAQFERRRTRAAPVGRAGAVGALAAAAVFALALIAVGVRLDHYPDVRTVAAGADPEATTTAAGGAAQGAEVPHAAERWLASLPREPVIVRVGTRADVLGLEDRIAEVDDLLSAGGTERGQSVPMLALQRERARLVGSLVQVRYAETLADQSR
ncbi:MAG: hypothetical protein ACHQD6_03110 [Steroidobacterales bacterium]|jgi:hypothetical protein